MHKFGLHIVFILLLSACGTPEEAVKKKITTKHHPYIETFHKAVRLKTTGRVEDAVAAFEECLTIREDDDAVYYALFELELLRNNELAASQHILKASALDPENIWYKQKLAYLYFKRDEYEKAITYFDMLVKEEPSNVEWLYGYAEALVKSGKITDAVEVMNKMEDQVGMNPQLSLQKYGLYMEAGKESDALNELFEVRKKFPRDPQIIATLVEHYLEKNEDDKAFDMLIELVEADPENGRARLALADFYRRQGKQTEAYAHLVQAFKSGDVDIDTKMRIVIGMLESAYPSDTDVTKTLVDQLVDQYPEEAKVHSVKADFLLAQGEEAAALISYKKALEYDQNQYPIWNQVLLMEYQLQEDENLYRDSKACLELFPTMVTVYLLNGISANNTQRYDEAMESLSVGVELVINDRPLEAEFYGQMGEAEFGLGNPSKGKEYYKKAINLDPNSMLIKNNFAYRLATEKTDLELAESLIESVLEVVPNHAAFIDTKGWVLLRKGDFQGAKEVFESGLASFPENAAMMEHLGDTYYMLGNTSKAIEWWLKANAVESTDLLQQKISEKKFYDPK